MKVSVLIPVYNAVSYITKAIESVLSQTINPYEVIIIDDGSNDGSFEIIRKFSDQIHYVYQKNQGTAVARNHGIALAKGEWIAFLDADDYWHPEKQRLQSEIIAKRHDLKIVSGMVQSFLSPELNPSDFAGIHVTDQPIAAEVLGASLIRRDVFSEVGPFDKRWEIGQDMAWMMRVKALNYSIERLPEVVLYRRIHHSNKNNEIKRSGKIRLQILKAHMDWMRARNETK